ncbi:MAG: DNA cytosine methyltransferase [Hyphomonadaceae bacterium]
MHRDSGAALYEFFAGGGLARAGLAPLFRCAFANDNDPAKAAAYEAAYGKGVFRLGDVWALEPGDIPGRAQLAWASFPCQDLSLAGARGGLNAPRSGAFWGFHRAISALAMEGRAPETLALENVCGLLTSRNGADFAALIAALDALGYRAGALEIDAAHFTPQSRPRLFIVATRARVPAHIVSDAPLAPFHSQAIRTAHAKLLDPLKRHWVWWRMPAPPARNTRLIDILEDDGAVQWNTDAQTKHLIAMMSALQFERLQTAKRAGTRVVGALFKRIRVENGEKVQRAEARFDGLAGCLRTPAGGSSRQALLVVEGERVRSRLVSPREAARLMGLPDDHPIPDNRNAALHLLGDAVCVPAVRFLGENILAPLAGIEAQRDLFASR